MWTKKDISTYVINLNRCIKKKNQISKMLKKNKLDFNIFNAVDSSNFTVDFIKNNNDIGEVYKNWLLNRALQISRPM